MNQRYCLNLSLLLPLLLLSAACDDPQKVIRKYFVNKQLNLLSPITTKIRVGDLYLIYPEKERPRYVDNMAHFADDMQIFGDSDLTDFHDAFESEEFNRAVEANAALKIIDWFLPFNFGASVKLNTNVIIDPGVAAGKRIIVNAIDDYLESDKSADFHKKLRRRQIKVQGTQVAIVYEVLRSKDMIITAERGRDITSSLKLDETSRIGSSEFGVIVTKESKSKLKLEGSQYFAFAFRAGELLLSQETQRYFLRKLDIIIGERSITGSFRRVKPIQPISLIGDDFEPINVEEDLVLEP